MEALVDAINKVEAQVGTFSKYCVPRNFVATLTGNPGGGGGGCWTKEAAWGRCRGW